VTPQVNGLETEKPQVKALDSSFTMGSFDIKKDLRSLDAEIRYLLFPFSTVSGFSEEKAALTVVVTL
jgi:hypothetical protein